MKFVERMWSESNGCWKYYIDGWAPMTDAEQWSTVYVEVAKVVLERDFFSDDFDAVSEIENEIFGAMFSSCGYIEDDSSYRDTFRGADGGYNANACRDYARYIFNLATFEPKELDLVF